MLTPKQEEMIEKLKSGLLDPTKGEGLDFMRELMENHSALKLMKLADISNEQMTAVENALGKNKREFDLHRPDETVESPFDDLDTLDNRDTSPESHPEPVVGSVLEYDPAAEMRRGPRPG
jgi:hypothetical protein